MVQRRGSNKHGRVVVVLMRANGEAQEMTIDQRKVNELLGGVQALQRQAVAKLTLPSRDPLGSFPPMVEHGTKAQQLYSQITWPWHGIYLGIVMVFDA